VPAAALSSSLALGARDPEDALRREPRALDEERNRALKERGHRQVRQQRELYERPPKDNHIK